MDTWVTGLQKIIKQYLIIHLTKIIFRDKYRRLHRATKAVAVPVREDTAFPSNERCDKDKTESVSEADDIRSKETLCTICYEEQANNVRKFCSFNGENKKF